MLGVEDRAAIMAGLEAGLSQVCIAHLIGRSPSVVCREIARHTGPDGQYRAEEADKAARAARRRPKKRLSLLSGGERSLAAIAFLVAIFKARPSPFYVMDEVEAALDDMNLTRLLAIFKELQETSQLIVITHQKRTMEIADALYGVTMRDGVTTVVSQRLER